MSSDSKSTFVQDLRTKFGTEPFTDSKDPKNGSILYLRVGKGADTWIVTVNYQLYAPRKPQGSHLVTYGVSVRNPRDSYHREYGQAVAWMRRREADRTFLSGPRRAFWGNMTLEDGVAEAGRSGVTKAVIARVTKHLSTDEYVPMPLRLATVAATQDWANRQQEKEEHAHA